MYPNNNNNSHHWNSVQQIKQTTPWSGTCSPDLGHRLIQYAKQMPFFPHAFGLIQYDNWGMLEDYPLICNVSPEYVPIIHERFSFQSSSNNLSTILCANQQCCQYCVILFIKSPSSLKKTEVQLNVTDVEIALRALTDNTTCSPGAILCVTCQGIYIVRFDKVCIDTMRFLAPGGGNEEFASEFATFFGTLNTSNHVTNSMMTKLLQRKHVTFKYFAASTVEKKGIQLRTPKERLAQYENFGEGEYNNNDSSSSCSSSSYTSCSSCGSAVVLFPTTITTSLSNNPPFQNGSFGPPPLLDPQSGTCGQRPLGRSFERPIGVSKETPIRHVSPLYTLPSNGSEFVNRCPPPIHNNPPSSSLAQPNLPQNKPQQSPQTTTIWFDPQYQQQYQQQQYQQQQIETEMTIEQIIPPWLVLRVIQALYPEQTKEHHMQQLQDFLLLVEIITPEIVTYDENILRYRVFIVDHQSLSEFQVLSCILQALFPEYSPDVQNEMALRFFLLRDIFNPNIYNTDPLVLAYRKYIDDCTSI